MIIAYVFVEWNGGDEHSVVEGKVVELMDAERGFIPGANVQCVLKEGKFAATIIASGKLCRLCNLSCVIVVNILGELHPEEVRQRHAIAL